VNYTAGLPVIRVSPDHGVGYDIAGQNIAQTSSVLSSIFLGIQLYANRKRYSSAARKNCST
jgi:4-hydroxythreonine-4-phosphate dehydrogenase